MKMRKITAILFVSALAMASINARATDTSGAAQLETNPPSTEGALTADQIPPITQKPASNINNNPQGGTQPTTGVMTPTGGNSTGVPAAPTNQPMNAVPASPNTGNASNPTTTGNALPPTPAAVNPNLPRQ
jgi:hypothetical protein